MEFLFGLILVIGFLVCAFKIASGMIPMILQIVNIPNSIIILLKLILVEKIYKACKAPQIPVNPHTPP